MREVLYLANCFHRLMLMYNLFLMMTQKGMYNSFLMMTQKRMYNVWVLYNYSTNISTKKVMKNYSRMDLHFWMRMMHSIQKIYYYRDKLMDNYMDIQIALGLIERSVEREKCNFQKKSSLFYLIQFFEWFIKINNSNNKSKDFFRKSSHMTNHKTTFKCYQDNYKKSCPQTNTTTDCPKI